MFSGQVSATNLDRQSKKDVQNHRVNLNLKLGSLPSLRIKFSGYQGQCQISLRDLRFADASLAACLADLVSFKILQSPPSDASPPVPVLARQASHPGEALEYSPVKVAKYFNDSEGLGGPWKVTMSSDASESSQSASDASFSFESSLNPRPLSFQYPPTVR